jgi:hypothetical protein
MKPVLASKPENENKVYMNLYDDIIHDRSPHPVPKFAMGDKVRITKKQSVFNNSTVECGLKNYLRYQLFSILIQLHIR